MLHLPTPGTDAPERRAGWHKLVDIFSGSMRESFISDRRVDYESLLKTLSKWESFARANDGKDIVAHPNTLDEWERMRAMLWCADHVQKTAPRLDGTTLPSSTELPADAPSEVRDRLDWSLACHRLLRGEAPLSRIAVPIALTDESIQPKGGIATLAFEAFYPGAGRLTLHPGEGFYILPDADFAESLNTAWRLALEITAKKKGQSNFPDVVWWLMKESPSLSGLDEKEFFDSVGLRWRGIIREANQRYSVMGRSASGAALRAFRHLLKGADCDPDTFVLAQVSKNVSPGAAISLQGVNGITSKVEAIADTEKDAVIVVTEQDKAEADLVVSRREAGLRIQIDMTIPPSIEELLDNATELSEEDRFADAVPILEKALALATEANHRTAETKIRIRLGHALFEGREDCTGAEEHFREALDLVPKSPTLMRHSALHGLADMLLWAGRLDEASAAIHSSLDVAGSLNRQDARGRSLISLGLLERKLGRAEVARSHLDEAIGIFSSLSLTLKGKKLKENAHALAVCYQNKAQLERDEGRPEEALVLYGKVEEHHRVSGDKLNSGKVHLLIGRLHCANGEFEEGFQRFKRAIEVFLELKNPLWMARVSESVARLYAQNERWKDALEPAFAAIEGFKEAGSVREQIAALLFAARLAAKHYEWFALDSVQRQIYAISKAAKAGPKDEEAEILTTLSAQVKSVHEEIAEKVRTHPDIRTLLDEAIGRAEKEELHEDLAECFLAELHLVTRREDKESRRQLREKAINALKLALEVTSVSQQRGHLMGELSALYHELGNKTEGRSWLRRAGEVFEKSGDVFGLATFHGSMAELNRADGDLDKEIASYERVLELIEGRSFHQLAAGTRINLANALRFRREFSKAQDLLTEAEAICEQHRMKDLINAIARNRSDIETELRAGQAASHTLPELLDSLKQLLGYKHENAAGYLAFWYFAWKTELMALLRSGPGISLIVVTDEVNRFVEFAEKYSNLAEHFLMATTEEPMVAAEKRALAIPPDWLFPADFEFLFVKRVSEGSTEATDLGLTEADDGPPNLVMSGPAKMLPVYIPVEDQSENSDEGHFLALTTPRLPEAALDLMTKRPITELVERRLVWFPSPRFDSKDPFLTDLRVAYERGLFPVYLDRIPTSDKVTQVGGVGVHIPASALGPNKLTIADRWKRALLKIPSMTKQEAQSFLTQLPDVFPPINDGETSSRLEVRLFEFTEIGRSVIRPVLLVRT